MSIKRWKLLSRRNLSLVYPLPTTSPWGPYEGLWSAPWHVSRDLRVLEVRWHCRGIAVEAMVFSPLWHMATLSVLLLEMTPSHIILNIANALFCT